MRIQETLPDNRPSFSTQKRDWYERVSLPAGRLALRLGCTPNFLTLTSVVLGLGSGIAVWLGQVWTTIALLSLSMLLDLADGAAARAGNLKSRFGALLDHVSDRYVEFFLLLGISRSGLADPTLVLATLFGMLIASYTRAAAESVGGIKNCAVGVVGRFEKLLLVMIGIACVRAFPSALIGYLNLLEIALAMVMVLSLATALHRLRHAWLMRVK